MELYQLKYFVQVARLQSISKAARSLSLSQPALSRAISKLEEELGVELFDRVGKRLYLNDRGGLFLQGVERAICDLDEVASIVGAASDSVEGSLAIGVFGPQAKAAACVARFMKDNPLYHVAFEARQQSFAARALQDYDVVFYPSAPAFEHIQGVSYARERTVLCVPRDHQLACKGAATLSEFENDPFIFTDTTAGVYERCYKMCVDSGFAPRVRAVTSSGAAQRKFIEEGLGVGFADVAAEGDLPGGSVACVELEGVKTEQVLCFASRPVARSTPAARRLLSFIVAYFELSGADALLSRFDENIV